MGLIMFIYRKEFFQALETLSHKLADMGYKGYLLMSLLIFTSAFPPLFGYATYQTLSGYTFGFMIGFPISYFSGLFGAVACFVLSKYFLKSRVKIMLANYPHLEAVINAVEKKGFKLFLLIRFSPYPFNMLNVLFSATNISVLQFTLGTGISLLKIAFHVYIGANLTSFVKHILGQDEDLTPDEIRLEKIRFAGAILFSIIATLAFAYVYRVAKQAVNEINQEQSEEQVAFLSHTDDIELEQQPHQHDDSMSLDNWENWDDEDDEEVAIPKNE